MCLIEFWDTGTCINWEEPPARCWTSRRCFHMNETDQGEEQAAPFLSWSVIPNTQDRKLTIQLCIIALWLWLPSSPASVAASPPGITSVFHSFKARGGKEPKDQFSSACSVCWVGRIILLNPKGRVSRQQRNSQLEPGARILKHDARPKDGI